MQSPIINSNTTLFLDRDGVLNHEKKLDYIRNWEEFKFYDGVLDALAILNPLFKTIVVVTNQKGIGKGLMTKEDLAEIHTNMAATITKAGGRIDKIYYCSDLADTSPNRKPNAGMAFMAKTDFPNIHLSNSLMVGNKLSDMYFARNDNIKSVFVATTNPEVPFPHAAIDYRFDNLLAFAKALIKS